VGIWKASKKAAKFAFVSMPMSIFGINQLKMGNRQILDLWKSLSNPVCPECDKGVLVMQGDEGQVIDQQQDGTTTRHLHPWVCNNCGFTFLEEGDVAKIRESAARYRNERVKAELADMEYAEREKIARGHRLHSRAFFVASTLAAIGFIYMLAAGASLLLALNWLTIAFALWVFGMKKSYRSWQAKTGNLFVDGAFWFWFKHEKWLV